MKTQASLHSSLRTLALSSVLLMAGAAQAGWGVSINLPIATPVQYYGSSSTTVYGNPGSQIISTRQVPQTVCRPVWAGSTTQQCSTEYVTVEDAYVSQQPVYIAPAPVYVAPPVYVNPSVTFGYPGYNNVYNNGYNHGYHRDRNWNPPSHHNRPPGPPPRTIYNGNNSGYGIGTYGPGVNLQINGR